MITIDTIKTTGAEILCLPCGQELDGAILTTEERPDLVGEECDTCGIRIG